MATLVGCLLINEDEFEFENALSKLTLPTKKQTKREKAYEHGIGDINSLPPHTLNQRGFKDITRGVFLGNRGWGKSILSPCSINICI